MTRAHRGGWLAVPVYVTQQPMPLGGWYVGPFVGYNTNAMLRDASDLTLAVEGGPRFALGARWSLSLAIQAGATALREAGETEWVNHLGIYPSIVLWPL